MIPLLLDCTGARVLVFGGGRVGARKARRFAREATVVVVSPTFADGEFGQAELVRARPTPAAVAGWLDRADPMVVIAATDDPELNAAIERAARERRILSNRADRSEDHASGDVVVPATYRDEPLVVAVGTGGASPALSRQLRQRIANEFAGAGTVATATAAAREALQDQVAEPEQRRAVMRRLVADDRLWDAAREGDEDLAGLAIEYAMEHLSATEHSSG